MMKITDIKSKIFELADDSLEKLALDVFKFQSEENPVYQKYLHHLNVDTGNFKRLEDIPHLPIELFKTQKIISTDKEAEIVFQSSGTTRQVKSRHFVTDLKLYEKSILKGFQHFYGDPADYCIVALLPSYLERDNASLVYMAKYLMEKSAHPDNGFYLNNLEELSEVLTKQERSGQKVLLLGVTFALLEMAEKYPQPLSNTTIMETGGMKGRGPEFTRMEVHERLKKAFGITSIHSEYGMTELLSQAYSKGDGIFHCPPWMHVRCREINDPFQTVDPGKSGMLQIIDLANLYSCSFIETSDLGKVHKDGSFEVLGRVDNSYIRGCNLMVL